MKIPQIIRVLLVLYMFLGSACHLQYTAFFDADWIACERGDAHYYRVYQQNKKLWVARDYYMSNDQLQNENFYASRKMESKNGISTWWDENGQMSSRVSYRKNIRHGKAEDWYENGQLQSIGEYVEGEKAGLWKQYYPNGQLKSETSYSMNVFLEHFWLESGEQILKNGHGSMIEYYENGQTKYKGDVENYRRIGVWKVFYPSGQQMEEVGFDSRGAATGLHRYFYENGSLEFTGQREEGKMVGLWMYFDRTGDLIFSQNFTSKASGNLIYQFGYRLPIPLNMDAVKAKIGYPQDAIARGHQGSVRVRVLVDKDGNYVRHQMVESKNLYFTTQVVKHLPSMIFTPPILELEKSQFWVGIPFNFKLLD